jgi:hypothetical protein
MTAVKPMLGRELVKEGGGGGMQKMGRENWKNSDKKPGNDQNGWDALSGFKMIQILLI